MQNLKCWGEDAGVQAFMTQQGFATVDEVRNYFEGRIQQIALNHSANSMFWEEVYDDGYTTLSSSIVDIWLSYDEVEKAVKSPGSTRTVLKVTFETRNCPSNDEY